MRHDVQPVRPPELRRAWFFIPGADASRHADALASGADAIVVDLEEMTAPADRPSARVLIVHALREAERRGVVGAVRINKLEHDGHADLQGIMSGAPRVVFLPHAESAEQLKLLDTALDDLERVHGIAEGSTEIVPTIESAKGLVVLGALLASSPRIRSCMLAVEDLAANLGARRTPGGEELRYARSRFLIECIAAGCVPIDLPCTYRSADVLAADLQLSTQLGFKSKCTVFVEQVDAINRALTPSDDEASAARALIADYEAQLSGGTSGSWIEAPDRNNAMRLLKRHAAMASFDKLIESTRADDL